LVRGTKYTGYCKVTGMLSQRRIADTVDEIEIEQQSVHLCLSTGTTKNEKYDS